MASGSDGGVVGVPGVLEGYAGSLEDSVEQILWGASRLTEALDLLAASRSEFLGSLGDHGRAVGQIGEGLRSLSVEVRVIAKAFRAADTAVLGVGGLGVAPNALAFKVPSKSTYSGGGKPSDVPSFAGQPVVSGVVPGPGNWAGIEADVIARGARVAASLRSKDGSSHLSEADVSALAAWWWSMNQQGHTKATAAVVNGLSLDDLARVRANLGFLDWYAFGEASKHVPANFGEVMVFLASGEAKKLSAGDLGVEVQRRLKVTDPLVLDAVLTYVHYQLGTARQLNDRVVRKPGELLVAGWFLPGFEPEWWTIVLARGAGGTGFPPVLLDGYVDAFGLLFQGKPLGVVQRHRTGVVVPPADFRAGLLLSIVAGLVVFPLVVAALPEGAAIAALTTAFGGTALAGLAAGVIVTACAGVLAGVSAVVAQRFVMALTNDLPWDEVLDEKVLARDAVLGGMLNAATFGVGQAISKVRLAIRATSDAKKLAVLRAELTALEETQVRLAAEQNQLSSTKSTPIRSQELNRPKPSVEASKAVGSLEGRSNIVVDDPAVVGRTITDIDRIENGILWEEKSAITALDLTAWIDKHINGKFKSYMEARMHLPGYENSPIGFDFTRSGAEVPFRAAVESRISELRAANPSVVISVNWR